MSILVSNLTNVVIVNKVSQHAVNSLDTLDTSNQIYLVEIYIIEVIYTSDPKLNAFFINTLLYWCMYLAYVLGL